MNFPRKISPPETSTTLLRDLASDTQHARWGEFVNRYRPMMDVYMREHFPTLEADEIIQRTLISLIRIFPVYHYCPDEKGLFHNSPLRAGRKYDILFSETNRHGKQN